MSLVREEINMSVMTTGSFLALAIQCAPNVHPDTSLDVVRVESGMNPYAIAEIIPRSERKSGQRGFISYLPKSKQEALKIVSEIEKRKHRYSVGLMQITSTNFKKLNVTADDLFSPCENLKAYEKIITDCWLRGGTLKRALSCYYSGNFSTGQESEPELDNTSYVQRIGYAPPDKKYVVPGTKNDQHQGNSLPVQTYERQPPSFESWDVLREYPLPPSGILPPTPQSEKIKDDVNEQADGSV
ncbi:lytic transglycosylase domain-containing protein [Salmonella enterica subsp. enterica]|nr:lytic transglycosylase domain-containing protein [Salmonella enterica subsp. enterica serovar Abony]